jgi:3-oxoacyl-[acyl-carrier-protein] synthase II
MITVLAVQSRTAPPTINLDNQDPEIPLFVPTAPHALGDAPQLAITNSFGFGGHNAVVAIRSYDG